MNRDAGRQLEYALLAFIILGLVGILRVFLQ